MRNLTDYLRAASPAAISWVGALLFTWIFFLPAFAPELQHGLLQIAPVMVRKYFTPQWDIPNFVRLRWLLTFLPAGMIVHHMLFLRYQRIKEFPHDRSSSLGARDPVLQPTAGMRETYFGARSLALSYFFPAIMVAALCSTLLVLVTEPATYLARLAKDSAEWHRMAIGMKAGFAGAYVYVVMTLAARTVRRDVTSGIAISSAATLVLGPTLAAGLAYFWTGAENGGFAPAAAFFAAGMAPQRFSGLIEEAGRRLVQPNQVPVERNIVPLHRLQGITAAVEERLMEEGISDATAFAYADPFALVRTTTYARRQIASWMDQALLMVTLPPALYEPIRAQGVTGVIDLAWYAIERDSLAALAEATKIAEPTLRAIAQRLLEDAQVRIIWTMYQTDSESEPDPARMMSLVPSQGQTNAA